MAPRGSQTKDLAKTNRLKRISRIKEQIAQLEKQGGTGKGSFRTKNKISQLKKTLRDIGGGYQKTKTYKTEKKEVKTSRGLKIRNVSTVKPKKDKKMSNIPVGEGYVNNPNYGKKPKKTESNTATESSSNTSNNSSSKTENKIDTKTAFSQDKPLVEKKKTEKKTEVKKKSKFIKTKKGTLAKRGSVTARRAENREAARKRAQAAAKLRIKKKKEKK